MLALYRSGRQAEALEAYRDARAALDELGIEPSAALRQLERQILTQDPALELAPRRGCSRTAQVRFPGRSCRTSPFPFVGRARELATLRSLLERAEGGEGGLVLLTGEAGAGKTRLVRELAHEAAGRGVLVCYGASDAAVTRAVPAAARVARVPAARLRARGARGVLWATSGERAGAARARRCER